MFKAHKDNSNNRKRLNDRFLYEVQCKSCLSQLVLTGDGEPTLLSDVGCGRPSSECLLLGKVTSDTSPTTIPCFTLAAAKGRPSAPAYPYAPAPIISAFGICYTHLEVGIYHQGHLAKLNPKP